MVIKTREKLIEVARQLFMKKGVENTTMNDIATASEKGRRTIYTYFKNKREIYNAVIEQQSEMYVHELRLVAALDLPPLVKLERFLTIRLRLFDEINNSLNERSRFFFRGDYRRFMKVVRAATEKEKVILNSIIDEGIEMGDFDAEQARRLPSLELMLSQGVDLSRISESEINPNKLNAIRTDIIDFIINGIKAKQ